MGNFYGRTPAWRLPGVSADGLKGFACVMTALSTAGIAVVEKGMLKIDQYTQEQFSRLLAEDSRAMFQAGVGSVLQLLGGLAVPIFAFLLVEGFLHTSDYRRYLASILVFAFVSEVPYDLAVYQKSWDLRGQNALFSLAVSLLMLYFLRMLEEKRGIGGILARLLVVFCAVSWVTFLRAGYGLCVVLLAAVFYLFRESSGWKMALGIPVSLLYVTGPLAFYGIWCYDGERKDRIPKYVYYAFYPLHLLILAGVGMMV